MFARQRDTFLEDRTLGPSILPAFALYVK